MENIAESFDGGSVSGECPHCFMSSVILDGSNGETVCASCGLVIEDKPIYRGPEWYPGEEDLSKQRASRRVQLKEHDMGLSTLIGDKRDSSGKVLSPVTTQKMQRLRMWQYRINTGNTMLRNLDRASGHFRKIKQRMHLPDYVVEHAAYIYRRSLLARLNRGRMIDVIATASLYTACRTMGTPRPLKDFTLAANVRKRDLARCYRLILKNLELEMPIIPLPTYICAVANRAGVSEKVKRKALGLSEASKTGTFMGKARAGLAAGFLYIASISEGVPLRQKDLAQVAGVTDVTVRNRCRDIKNWLKNSGDVTVYKNYSRRVRSRSYSPIGFSDTLATDGLIYR